MPTSQWKANRRITSPLRVSEVVDMLGPQHVTMLSPPHRDDAQVGDPRIWDPHGRNDITAGDLVLAVNVTADEVGEVIAAAAAGGACAVALKGAPSTLHEAIGAADLSGIGLIAVDSDASWDQVYALVLNASTNAIAPTDDPTPMGDLFALANAMAATIGAAVTIEDPRGDLLAYSNLDQPIDEARRDTILGRKNPGAWSRLLEESGYYRRLSTAQDGVVRISDTRGKLRDRMAILIKAGAEVLGSIWVVEGDDPLGPRAEAALREATPLAAMHLLRQRAFVDSSRGERGALLRGVLEDGPGEIDYASALGIDLASPCIVVAFHLVAVDDDDVLLSVSRTRVIDAVTVACESFRRRVVCTWIGQTIYALFPATTRESVARLESIADDICSRFGERLGVQLVAGISSMSEGLSGARECRSEADRVVRVLRDTPIDRAVATIDEVRVQSILLTLADLTESRPDLRLPGIDRLVAHDAEHSKTYMQTMRAFIEASGNVAAVATALDLHTNTVRYRVRRLEEISGLYLDDPDHRLVIAVDLLNRTDGR